MPVQAPTVSDSRRAVQDVDLPADAAKSVHDRALHRSAAMSGPLGAAVLPDGWSVPVDRVPISDVSGRRRTRRSSHGCGNGADGRGSAPHHRSGMPADHAALPTDTAPPLPDAATTLSDRSDGVLPDARAGMPSDRLATVQRDARTGGMPSDIPAAVSPNASAEVSAVSRAGVLRDGPPAMP